MVVVSFGQRAGIHKLAHRRNCASTFTYHLVDAVLQSKIQNSSTRTTKMSNLQAEDDQLNQQNDPSLRDAPAGIASDNDYTSRTGQKQAPIPVQSDDDPVEDPIDPETADSDKQLGAFYNLHNYASVCADRHRQ
jgi:hypothetical protein